MMLFTDFSLYKDSYITFDMLQVYSVYLHSGKK